MTRNFGPGLNQSHDPTTILPKVVTPSRDHVPPVEITDIPPVVPPPAPPTPDRGATPRVPDPEPRRSTRPSVKPKRLIEEDN